MARMKMVWRKCWSCDHVNPGVHMIRNRRAFRCEACGEVNDYVDSQYSVKTVFYIKPNYWTTLKKSVWYIGRIFPNEILIHSQLLGLIGGGVNELLPMFVAYGFVRRLSQRYGGDGRALVMPLS